MSPDDLRRSLRARRQEVKRDLRRNLADMRARARDRVQALRTRQDPNRRRRRLALAVPPLLVIAALLRCDCERQPAKLPEPVQAQAGPKAPPAAPAPRPPRPRGRAPLAGEVDRRPRPGYQTGAQPPPTWIDEFRLQATARSPRLAQCFEGTDRPGALRWVAALNPETGSVSDQDLEPVGPHTALTVEQRACVARALATPGYRLTRPPNQPFPERVSLVIEF